MKDKRINSEKRLKIYKKKFDNILFLNIIKFYEIFVLFNYVSSNLRKKA